MFFDNRSKVKKGHICLYSILIGSFVISLAFYSFTLELKGKRLQQSIEKTVLKSSEPQEYREVLFTELSQCIKENLEVISKETVKEYFNSSPEGSRFTYNKAYLRYEKEKDYFILAYYYDEAYHKEDIYEYEIEIDKIRLYFTNTFYVGGKV